MHHNLNFEYENTRLSYNNKTLISDFKIGELFLEVKGYKSKKIDDIVNAYQAYNYKLRILYEQEIKFITRYLKRRGYDIDFLKEQIVSGHNTKQYLTYDFNNHSMHHLSKTKKQIVQESKIELARQVAQEKLQKSISRKIAIDHINAIYINNILNSSIKFDKFGWVKEVAKIINKQPQKVNKWMLKYMPTFYNEKCFKKLAKS